MPKNVLPRALVVGDVGDDPIYVGPNSPLPIGGAALDLIDADLDTVNANLGTLIAQGSSPLTSMPPFERKTTPDLAHKKIDTNGVSAGADYELVAAVAGKVVNVFSLRFTIPAAGVVSLYSDASGGTPVLLEEWEFPSSGGGIAIRSEAWPLFPSTALSKSLVLRCSTTARIRGSVQTLQV